MSADQPITADDVLLACDMAVRMTFTAAAKMIRNHRGRVERGRYTGVPDAELYAVLVPGPSAAELDQYFDRFNALGHLPSVLGDAQIGPRDLYGAACMEYARVCMETQTPHNVANLRAYLMQVDQVVAS